MSILMPWLSHAGYALALLALIFIPGWAALRAAGCRGPLPLAAAPPVTLAAVSGLGQVYAWTGVRYSLMSLSAGLVVCMLLVRVAVRLVLGPAPPAPPEDVSRRRGGTALLALGAAVLAGILIALPILKQWDPDLPAQQIDSVFHYNLAWTITQTGDASLLGGASWSSSLYAVPAYYPLVWHALVAAVAGPVHVVVVTNVLVVLIPIIWTLGVAALALEAFPASRWAPVTASFTMTLLPAFPVYMLAYRQLWPNSIGYAVLPATLALLCRAVRMLRAVDAVGRRRAVIALLVFVAALIGVAATYPSAFFSVLFTGSLLLLDAVSALIGLVFRRPEQRRLGIVLAGALALGLVLVLRLVVVARLAHDDYAGLSNLMGRLRALITLWPFGNGGVPYLCALTLHLLLTAAGLVVVVRRRQWRWMAWGWLLPMILLTATYLPMGPLTAFTGLWYNDPYRVIPLVFPAIALLAAASVEALVEAVARLPRAEPLRRIRDATAVVCAGVLLLGGWGAGSARASVSESSYDEGSNALVRTLNAQEAAMIESLRGRTDPSLMVLGDPAAGAAYVEVLTGLRSVFPHITFRYLDWDARYLAEHFSDIGKDPAICEIVRHYRVGYYYADEAGTVPGIDVSRRAPGLYEVDTSTGFEPVARAGTASVWRITACGDIDSVSVRDPWSRSVPYEPLYGPEGEPNTFDGQGRLVLSD